MKRLLVLIFIVLFLQGDTLLAVETMVMIIPNQAFYRPGDSVNLHVQTASGAMVEATIRYLTTVLETVTVPVVDGAAEISWTPPALAPRGYGVDVLVLDEAGKVIGETSGAFDVLESWIQSPRYGFLTEFQAGRNNIDETMEGLTRYHVNGLQFYDWQYRHETLLPPEGSDIYSDLLGRNMSLETIKALIDAAHARNIAAMPYTAIYGASAGFYELHPDWALFQAPGEPYRFGDNFLMIMNPTPGTSWADHLIGEFARVLDETAFDGIHIDQYGAPKVGLNSSGESVHLDMAFPAFIDASAEMVESKRGEDGVVIFNAVGNWPVDTVAPANQDAVYIEVWQPYRNFMDLHRIVVQAQALGGGKPVIIAAYIFPDQRHNVRLANAIIFASGGYHLELGEPGTMLADPYFPKFGVMDSDMQVVMGRYYDFLVRYENVLALNTHDVTADRANALTIEGVKTQSLRSRDRVAVIVRGGENFETFSLVNLLDLSTGHWDEALAGAPSQLTNLDVKLYVAGSVQQVWAASPDREVAPQLVTFTSGSDDGGTFITFSRARLDYWDMIVVEYTS